MKYKFEMKFKAELKPLLDAEVKPQQIAYLFAVEHGYAKALELAISALGSLYVPIKEGKHK